MKTKLTKTHRAFIRINGRLVSRTFSRKADAERWYSEQKQNKELVESGLAENLKTQSVLEFGSLWLKTRRLNGQPLSSYVQEESRMRLYVFPKFGTRDLDTVSTTEWEVFLNELMAKHELGSSTRNRVRAMMSKLYSDAMRQRVVKANPITLIPKLKERATKWDYLKTSQEAARYLESAKVMGEGFYLFACLALNTGMRLGEILALTSDEVDLAKRRIRIWRIVEAASDDVCERTKGFNERWLGINDSLLQVLSARIQRAETELHEPLIVGDKGVRLDHRFIRKLHLKCCKRAGLPSIRVHDLRHTFASHYIMNGGSLAELQGLLGHTSPSMALKYAHMAPGFLESRASVVSFSSDGMTGMKLVVNR